MQQNGLKSSSTSHCLVTKILICCCHVIFQSLTMLKCAIDVPILPGGITSHLALQHASPSTTVPLQYQPHKAQGPLKHNPRGDKGHDKDMEDLPKAAKAVWEGKAGASKAFRGTQLSHTLKVCQTYNFTQPAFHDKIIVT